MQSDFDALLRDMLKDLSDSPAGRENSDDMQEALSLLEQQLDSAGAHVVQTRPGNKSAADRNQAGVTATTHDAWVDSLSNLEALQLADFLAADAAAKSKKNTAPRDALIDMQDYDVTEPMLSSDAVATPVLSNITQTPAAMAPPLVATNAPPVGPMVVLPPPPPPFLGSFPVHPFPPNIILPPTASATASPSAQPNLPVVPLPPLPFFRAQDYPPLGTNTPQPATDPQQTAAVGNHRIGPATLRLTFHDASPHAPPIPASTIPTSCMTPRDLCYVIHSMMKPVLSFASVLDMYNADYYKWGYDQRTQVRYTGGIIPTPPLLLPNPVWKETKQNANDMEQEYLSHVERRAQEWSKEKQSLGKLVKVDVKRPRALLATSLILTRDKTRTTTDAHNATQNLGEEEAAAAAAAAQASASGEEDEDEAPRMALWKARVSIDQGYQSYLNLVELRRLLQTRGKQHVLSQMDPTIQEPDSVRRLELLKDVETNIGRLHTSFGFVHHQPMDHTTPTPLTLDETTFALTLGLPKGKILLSRIIDEGILPHSSACMTVSKVLRILLQQYLTTAWKTSSPLKYSCVEDDRLLVSLTGLVRLMHPSPSPKHLIDSLIVVNQFSKREEGKSLVSSSSHPMGIMKLILSNHRTLLELFHAVLSRGGEICSQAGDEESFALWKVSEKEFVSVLTSSQ